MNVQRVQTISSMFMPKDEIPDEFIRSEHEQPGLTTFHGPVPDVPVIDLSDPDQEQVVREIVNASEEWGIFQVVNHGLPIELINRLQRVGKELFELPPEEKEKYAIKPGSGPLEGYGTELQKELEGKKTWVDFFFQYIWPPSRIDYRFWPENPPSYREVHEEYGRRLVGVVEKVLSSLSLGLGLEEGVMKDGLGGGEMEYRLKINYYPPCPRPDLALGVGHHTDFGGITILVPNDVAGLQIFKGGIWFPVNYTPNALIVQIGDQIQVLSNGKYKSVMHRSTVNKEKTRMSWPVFCSPPGDMVVGPLPQLINDDNPPNYKPKMFKDYRYCKLNKLPLY